MTSTKFSHFFAMLTIIFLVSSCVSPTQVTPTITPTSITLTTAAPTPTSTTLPTAAPTPTQTAEAQLVAKIDELVTALVEQDRFMGSILVVRDGKVLISKGYGMANLELDVPNTPQTKFRLASITKQFTAMAILQLQQQGKLLWDSIPKSNATLTTR